MEHVTEALYMSAAAGLFMVAVSLTLLAGRSVDRLFSTQQVVSMPGALLWEEMADE